jgi:hypothetical protein
MKKFFTLYTRHEWLFFIVYIILLSLAIAALTSCRKVPMREPTCQRVYMFNDHYNGDTVYTNSDTLWPWGQYANALCDSDLADIKNYKPILQGCVPGGYQRIHYSVGRLVNEIKFYK